MDKAPKPKVVLGKHSLKTCNSITLIFLLTFLGVSFPVQGFVTFYYPSSNSHDSYTQATAELMATNHSLSPVAARSTSQVSNSIVNVYQEGEILASVIAPTCEGFKLINVEGSTLIDPPDTLSNKLDSNILNLTKLVAGNYLEHNRTNVIIHVSQSSSLQHASEQILQASQTSEIRPVYTSSRDPSNLNLLSAELDYLTIFDIAEDPSIDFVWLDRKFEACLDQSVQIIKDPAEWASVESLLARSVNGSGVKVAILDTGIDSSHPDFYFPNGTSKIILANSFTGETIGDENGHGTHVASIAAGTGAASSGSYVGVAPGALLLDVKVLDNTGNGLESWIISGIQWAVDNGADVISMSLGGGVTSNGTDPLSLAVDWAAEQGVVPVVAAGNFGSQLYTITDPGVAMLAITVGASTKQDTIASFSSRGPTIDYRVKPDVLAPGVSIVAARANGTVLGTVVSEYYTRASGTSMATPHVAGAAALLLDAYPDWNPALVKMALANSAESIEVNVLAQGSGRIDVPDSVTASIASNSSISFGRTHRNTMYERVIVFENLIETAIDVALDWESWDINSKVFYDVVSPNTSILTIPSNEFRAVELQLDTSLSLPNGYFEGRVTAAYEGKTINIPLFFCVLSELKCEVVSEIGVKLKAAFVVLNPITGETIDFSFEDAGAQFFLQSGEYIVQAMSIYGLSYSGSQVDESYSFLVHQRFSIGSDEDKSLELSLASAYKLSVRTTDLTNTPLHLSLKQFFSSFYSMTYFADINTLSGQYLYLTNISEYMTPQCYFGFMGFSEEDTQWDEAGLLHSNIDAYFLGWDISKFGLSEISDLTYANTNLATFDVQYLYPTPSDSQTIWFNNIASLWQTGFWYGFETYPGNVWRLHILPCQFKESPSESWAELEWSCIYASGAYPDSTAQYFVIDRHFQPIEEGESFSYSMGKTPLLPQQVHNNTSYYGDGLYVPYYPLRIQNNLFLSKSNPLASKQIEVFKDGGLVYNGTMLWATDPISIESFLDSYGYGYYSFVVKTETNLSLSSKNTAKYMINYTSSNVDLLPPSLLEINAAPCFAVNEYPVEIKLADNMLLDSVSLYYSLDDGPWTSILTDDFGGGVFSATISLESSTQKLSLAIEAEDASGNKLWFSTEPVARRGYETRISATLESDRISGQLSIVGGALLQPVYLKVNTNETTMYILTDHDGNFEFAVPQSLVFPLEIEMINMGPYAGSTSSIYSENSWPYDVTGDNYCGIDDIVAVAAHFSFQPGDPEWNPKYDVDGNDYVGIDDIILVSEHFGEKP